MRDFKKWIDIRSFNKALICAWIKKYLDKNNKGKWKCNFEYDLENFMGPNFFFNLNIKDVKESSHSFNPSLWRLWKFWPS